MSSFFGSDGPFSLQFAIIFAVIFLMLAVGVLVLRRFTGQGAALSNKAGARGRQPRLGIVDIYELDRQRQLILLRRDNVEHLLLVGGPNDVVVERNILRGINARLATEEAAYDEPSEPSQDFFPPQDFAPPQDPTAPQRPAPQSSVPQGLPPHAPALPYREPAFEMPLVVPAPAPGSEAPSPAVARPLDLPPREAGGLFRPAPPRQEPPRQDSPRQEPRSKESPLARVIRRAPPSLVNLVPAALAERVRMPESQPEPAPAPSQAPPVVAPPASRAIDAAILSDMARQLEEALRRPATAVRPAVPVQSEAAQSEAEPEPVAAEPEVQDPAPEPESLPATDVAPETPPQPVDPIAAAMAATAQPPEPVAAQDPELHDSLFQADPTPPPPVEPPSTDPAFVDLPAPEPVAALPPQPELVAHATVADAPHSEEPAPAPAPEEVPHQVPPPVPPKPPAPATPNPFSVEEIEAEFARLLGRPLDRK